MASIEGTERKTLRLEAFSDAVLAIAITLPVVELLSADLSSAPSLAEGYAGLRADYLTYGLSFLVIGLYWARSHFSGKIVDKTDHGFNLLTLVFLAAVSLTPFPARHFAEHLAGDSDSRTAALVYACVLAAPSTAWLARWAYAVRMGLLDPRLTPKYLRGLTTRYTATALCFVLGAAIVAVVDWRLGMAVTALVSLTYLLPPSTPEYQAGQEPEDELEEADERPRGREGASPDV